MKPNSTAPGTDALTTRPSELFYHLLLTGLLTIFKSFKIIPLNEIIMIYEILNSIKGMGFGPP